MHNIIVVVSIVLEELTYLTADFVYINFDKRNIKIRNSRLIPRRSGMSCWKKLPSNAVKTVTENTGLCAVVMCKVHSRVA
jgi:hypothetical protein